MENQDLIRLISDEASDSEKKLVYAKLADDSEKEKEFIKLKKLWDLDLINQSIALSSNTKPEFDSFWKLRQVKPKKITLLHNLMRYAAILVLALFAGFYGSTLLFEKDSESVKRFYTENGSISNIELEDGSKIILNANSSISINQTKRKIEVDLEGEAFFDVIHNENREFIVDLGKIKVYDLGTKFNISAYPDEDEMRTTLIEGDIDLLSEADELISSLKVNQTFAYNTQSNTYKKESIDPIIVTGWKENKFVFIDKALDEICDEIEKWYGIDIVIDTKHLEKEVYTCVVNRTTTVNQMLEMFALTSGINYHITHENNEGTRIHIRR